MKILIVKTSSLGDIIHVFPVIGFLKQKYPDSQIDWVVEAPFAELVEAHPQIDKVFRIETKNWRKGKNLQSFWKFRKTLQNSHYDVLFDLQGNAKSGFFTFLAKARQKVGFGRKNVPEWPNLLVTNTKIHFPSGKNIRQDYLHVVQSHLGDQTLYEDKGALLNISHEDKAVIKRILDDPRLTKRPLVMVCSGSAWPNKQMTQIALETSLKNLHKKENCSFLFVWGNDEEKKSAQAFRQVFEDCSIVVDRLPIPVLQNLMSHMHLVIAMDSLPLHLAGTTAVPTFGVFGASSAQKYQPLGEQHRFFQGSCPYGQKFEKRCPRLRTCKTGACIRTLESVQF